MSDEPGTTVADLLDDLVAFGGYDLQEAAILRCVREDCGHYRVPARDVCGERIPPPEPGSVRAILNRIWFVEALEAARDAGRPDPCFAGFEAVVEGRLE